MATLNFCNGIFESSRTNERFGFVVDGHPTFVFWGVTPGILLQFAIEAMAQSK